MMSRSDLRRAAALLLVVVSFQVDSYNGFRPWSRVATGFTQRCSRAHDAVMERAAAEMNEAPLQAEQTSNYHDGAGGGGGSKMTASELVKDFFLQAKTAGSRRLDDGASASMPAANAKFINDIRILGSGMMDKIATFPSSREEAWKYTSLKTLFELGYAPCAQSSSTPAMREIIASYVDKSCTESCLVFLDGRYCTELSNTKAVPAGVTLSSLGHLDAAHFGATLRKIGTDIVDSLEMPRNSFASDILSILSLANTVDGALLSVPKDTVVEVPMQVLFYSTLDSLARHTVAFPRLVVDIDANSKAKIKQTFVGGDGSGSSSGSSRSGSSSSSSSVSNISSTRSSSNGGSSSSAEGNLVLSNTRVSVAQGARLLHTYEQDLPMSSRHVEVLAADIKGESR